jgi:hypothetical protein
MSPSGSAAFWAEWLNVDERPGSISEGRGLDVCVIVAPGVVVLAGRPTGFNVDFVAQREPPALGDPDLAIGRLVANVGPLEVHAVHRCRFPVDRLIA